MISNGGHATRRLVSLFVAVLIGVVLAQLGGRIRLGTDRAPAPDPTLVMYQGSVDRDSRQNVIAYARTLQFSEATGAGDEQRLTVGADSVPSHGPLVRVEPVVGANRSRREQLATGLLVARFINHDPVPYPQLSIGARDTTYWWADSVARGRWRALYLSSDPAIPPVELELHLDQVPDAQRNGLLPSARWLFTDEGEKPWVTCSAAAACRAGDLLGG